MKDKRTPTDHFAYLGAPLRWPRQSWGALRHSDNTLFLRTWESEIEVINGVRHCMVLRLGQYKDRPGHNERYRQLELITAKGLTCYLVIARKKDPTDIEKSEIADYDDDYVLSTGRIVPHNGCLYIAAPRKVAIADVLPKEATA